MQFPSPGSQLDALLETTSDLVCFIGRDGRLERVNPSFEAALGRPAAQLVGDDFLRFVRAEDRPVASSLLAKLGTTKVRGEVTVRCTHSDGSDRLIAWRCSVAAPFAPICATGRLVGGPNGSNDHTPVHAVAERVLRASEQRFRALVENASDPIFILAADGTARYASPAFARVLGYTPNELEGRRNLDMLHPDDQAGVRELFARLLREPDNLISATVRVRHHDGSWRTLSTVARSLLHEPAVGGVVFNMHDITDSERMQAELRAARSRYQNLVETLPIIVYSVRPEPPYAPLYLNSGISALGYAREEWLDVPDRWVRILHPDDRDRVLAETEAALAAGHRFESEYRIMAKDGSVRWLHDQGDFVRDEAGHPTAWQGVMVDITARRELEEQLRQAQKMRAVGELAGGVAHDFNNLLTVIETSTELLAEQLDPASPFRNDVGEIAKAAARATALTRQLLAFGRKQLLKPTVLDINGVVVGLVPMLTRLIGEDITVVTALSHDLGSTLADPGQIEQVLVNLVVNARDAMPRGGTLTIASTNALVKAGDAAHQRGVRPGEYVALSVSDTGRGMDEATRDRVFEPFFTTKEMGHGTGLGLSTVYGIVKQSDGYIWAESEPGRGATFRVFLARAVTAAPAPAQLGPTNLGPSGTETILVVEDEDAVRRIVERVLKRQGYTVLAASGGAEALEMAAAHPGTIDMLVSDLVMPGMGGNEAYARLASTRPGLRVLFMSGYTDQEVVRRGLADAATAFLQKPFSMDSLARCVRAVLDGEALLPDQTTSRLLELGA